MIPTLILVSYRYLKFSSIEDKNKPFICIYAAILSILIVGYVNALNIDGNFFSLTYILAHVFFVFLQFIRHSSSFLLKD
jgi:exfoliative toxin A/B